MKIDYRIFDGPRGGLAFDFIPCMYAKGDGYDYDRHGSDVFSVREEAFLFIEGMIVETFPAWRNYGHWGVHWWPRENWFDVLNQFWRLRRDVAGNAKLETLVQRYVYARGLMPPRHRLHRRALLRFLDQFEDRVRSSLERYPYLIIMGI